MQYKLGILGEARAGKDTVAGLITQAIRKQKVEVATQYVNSYTFSSGIHSLLKGYVPELYAQGKPRDALQRVGQLLREYNPDVWIDRLFSGERFKHAEANGFNILITDVRQTNEAQALRDKGFILLKVTANRADRVSRMQAEGDSFTAEHLEHETEHSVHRCVYDYEISNNGTLEELEAQVITVLQQIRGGQA